MLIARKGYPAVGSYGCRNGWKGYPEKLPRSCRRVGANSGGVGHCSPKMVLVQVATVVAIVMVLWYQSSPIQYLVLRAASRLLVLCVQK